MRIYSSLELAMQDTLSAVRDNGIFTSPRGRDSREILGYGYILSNPRNRLVGFKARNINPYYLIGNLLWVLRQSNKLDIINYYNPRGDMFSDDGEILRGAYGKRIFDFDGVNQWNQCIKELKADKDSRRAIITFHLPQHDWTGSLDTPCTANIQFFIRDNKLILINTMRSQSAAFVQPYDVFLMTMLQELMANELNIEVGEYQHHCNSYHYHIDEQNMIENIINSNDYTDEMPKMEGNMQDIRKLLIFEKELRLKAISLKEQGMQINQTLWSIKLNSLNISEYWFNIGIVLILKAMEFTGIKKEEPQFKFIVKNNLPSYFSKLF